MELNSLEAIVALVRQGFGVSIVPRLANLHWAKDRALRIVALPGLDVQPSVGLLERRQHSRQRVTEAIKAYFAASVAPGPRQARSGLVTASPANAYTDGRNSRI